MYAIYNVNGGEPMQAFEIAQLMQKQRDSGESYLEFLKVPDLSMGSPPFTL